MTFFIPQVSILKMERISRHKEDGGSSNALVQVFYKICGFKIYVKKKTLSSG